MNIRHLCLAIMGLAATNLTASAQDKLLRWHDSLDRGTESAKNSEKPLFVVFRCVR